MVHEEVEDTLDYLRTGGMGEVIGLVDLSKQMGHPKVQMDTAMAEALCLLASEALDQREAVMKAGGPFVPFGRQ